jgi:ribosomal protein L24E
MEPEELSKVSIYVFLEHYLITNDQSQKLDFIDHPFLYDIYGDWSKEIVCLKAAQIGFSTMANIKIMWLAKNWRKDGYGFDIIYSLPSASDMNLFVSSKTNRLIANNPIFQEWTDDKDSIEQKKIGKSTIHFRGTQTEQAALAIPADLYVADEVDRSKADIVAQFSTRLQHSDYQWRWLFSNPSIPGVGVDIAWQKSDQKHWFIKCLHCNHWQYLTMENIMGEPPIFGCVKCKKELDRRDNHGTVKWVRKYMDREVSGYWISLLMNPKVSAAEILKKKKEYTDAQFHNYVLGLPYLSKGSKLLSTMFFSNLTSRVNPMDSRVIIGADTGNDINIVCGNKYGLFYHSKTSGYTEIYKLMRQWPTAILLIDSGGDITGPKQLKETFPNRVYTCFLRNDRKNDKLADWNDEDMTVVIDRNKLIQLCVDEFSEHRLPIYGTQDDWFEYWIEWDRMRRVEEVDDKGDKTYEWQKTPGQRSDYPFCQIFARVGFGRFMDEKVSFVSPSQDSFAQVGMDVSPDGTTRFDPRIVF